MRVKLGKGGVDLPKLLPQVSEVAACREELVALWLFGSYAEQRQTPLSDLDFAYLLIARLTLPLAEDYASVFRGLSEGGIISSQLADDMADMARFRNLLVHLYWTVDHQLVSTRCQHVLPRWSGLCARSRRI